MFASSQMGLVTVRQLRDAGIGDAVISDTVARGRLHPVLHGVYSVGHRYLAPRATLLAAILACGDGSVVSHGTAAWLLGLREWRPEAIDVIAPVEVGRKISGIRRRFVPPPTGREVWRRDGVPVTSPARTIVDCAGSANAKELADLIEQAAVLRLLNIEAIDEILDGPRRHGAKRLLRVVAPWRRYRAGIKIRSRMEAKLLPLLTETGLPIPETNAKLWAAGKPYEIDFLWRRQRVVVETDGGRFHDNPAAGGRDSRRNRALIDAGFDVARLGWEDFRDRPEEAMSELARLLRS